MHDGLWRCTPKTSALWEVEAGERLMVFQDHSWLHSEFEVSLEVVRSCQKQNK